MISRRQLRIKVLQTLYAYYKTEDGEVAKAEKELLFTINKAYDLYHYLLILIVELANYSESRIDLARNKLVPSHDDLHPNTRFIDCKHIEQLRNCDQLIHHVELKKLNWVQSPELIKEIFGELEKDEVYQDFMSKESISYADETKLLTRIFTHIVFPSENLDLLLEEQSIYWNDDFEYIVSMILKTIKRFKEDDSEKEPILELYKNPEDKGFAVELFRKTISNRDEYMDYIKSNTKNWDVDRIAFMDILIMQMSIAEFIGFSSIPTKVTMNEYLDISKMYSTNKSNVFINGVLDKVLIVLRDQKKIKKAGRGLIGEFDGKKEKKNEE